MNHSYFPPPRTDDAQSAIASAVFRRRDVSSRPSGVTAGSYGSATQVGTFTVDSDGNVTTAANTTIAIPSTAVTDFTEAAQDATGAMVDSTLVYTDSTPLLQRAALTGDVTASAGSNATTIANDAVTYAKMQNVSATSRILGRKTASAGDPEECTLSEVLDFIGSAAQGDILYRDSSAWARLGAGTSGYFLKTQGAAANPTWASVSASGGLVGLQVLLNGTTTYTPTSGTNTAIVLCVGGGGGSGGLAATANNAQAGSGGGGGWSIKRITGITGTYTVAIGAGGTAGGASNSAGGTGGTTSFGSGPTFQATGGVGGNTGAVGTKIDGVLGGAGSSGDANGTGGSSGPSFVANACVVGGNGGCSIMGGGAAGVCATGGSAVGIAGTVYGGGASGAIANGGSVARAGAAGANGVMIIWEYS